MRIVFDQQILFARKIQMPRRYLVFSEFEVVPREELLVHQLQHDLESTFAQLAHRYTCTQHQQCGSMSHVARQEFDVIS